MVDIFLSKNSGIKRGTVHCGKAELLAVRLDQEEVDVIWSAIEAEAGLEITVDLAGQSIHGAEHEYTFDIDGYMKWRLTEGLDDIDLTELAKADIELFESKRMDFLPTTL